MRNAGQMTIQKTHPRLFTEKVFEILAEAYGNPRYKNCDRAVRESLNNPADIEMSLKSIKIYDQKLSIFEVKVNEH